MTGMCNHIQIFPIEIHVLWTFLPRLDWNCETPNVSFPSSLHSRHESPAPGIFASFNPQWYILVVLFVVTFLDGRTDCAVYPIHHVYIVFWFL
jgi:hypothetical protein